MPDRRRIFDNVKICTFSGIPSCGGGSAGKKTEGRAISNIQRVSEEEIKTALSNLSDVDWSRLVVYARRRLQLIRRSAAGQSDQDLIQTAIVKTLSGERVWPKHKVSIVGHLLGIIRSDTSHMMERCNTTIHNEPHLQSELITGEGDSKFDPMEQATISALDPRFTNSNFDHESEVDDLMAALVESLKDDPAALEVLDYLRDNMSGPGIQLKMGISAKEYAAIHRRIVRKIPKLAGEENRHD